jgi:hypothetical protein
MVIPDNIPTWAKVGLQWLFLAVGPTVAITLFANNVSNDVKTALGSLGSINQAIVEIRGVIAPIDVDRFRQAAVEISLRELRVEKTALQDEVNTLKVEMAGFKVWRDSVNRRFPAPPQ